MTQKHWLTALSWKFHTGEKNMHQIAGNDTATNQNDCAGKKSCQWVMPAAGDTSPSNILFPYIWLNQSCLLCGGGHICPMPYVATELAGFTLRTYSMPLQIMSGGLFKAQCSHMSFVATSMVCARYCVHPSHCRVP